jgi:hypothetical protein
VFGWFLQPGKLYDLYTGEERQQDAAVQNSDDVGAVEPQQMVGRAGGAGATPALGRRSTQQAANGQQAQQEKQPQDSIVIEQLGLDPAKAPKHCKLARQLLAKADRGRGRQQNSKGDG